MKDLVANFPNQLLKAVEIAKVSNLNTAKQQFTNVLIAGLGGSGIGASIIAEHIQPLANLPVTVVKSYVCPSFVGTSTLFIASSYSGNTEETLEVANKAKQKGAFIVCITSGGALAAFAKENNYGCILVPTGFPPRSCLGYSFTQLLHIFNFYKIISTNYLQEIIQASYLISGKQDIIKQKALEIATQLKGKIPVIYTLSNEGIAVRLRQQINENAKVLCWHQVIPEMNHNELVGWVEPHSNIVVLVLKNKSDLERNVLRYKICKPTFEKYAQKIVEIESDGITLIDEFIYHIHLGDWISIYLSELNNVDAMDIDIINFLKSELKKS